MTTTLVSSKVDWRRSMRMLASPLLLQKRASTAPAKIVILMEKVLRQAHLTIQSWRTLWRCTRTNGHRAGTHKVHMSLIPQVQEYLPSITKFGITKNYEQMKQPNGKRQPCQTLRSGIPHDYFLKNKGIRYCPKHDLRLNGKK